MCASKPVATWGVHHVLFSAAVSRDVTQSSRRVSDTSKTTLSFYVDTTTISTEDMTSAMPLDRVEVSCIVLKLSNSSNVVHVIKGRDTHKKSNNVTRVSHSRRREWHRDVSLIGQMSHK